MHAVTKMLALWIPLTTLTFGRAVDADEARVIDACFSGANAWQVFADEPWWARVDLRDMLSVFHPLVVPSTGNSAGASCRLTIPAAWQPPFALRFFCEDNYFADPENHKPGQPGTESFFDHRFKQVLIDGQVVWERDVIDENLHASQSVFQVDITPYVTPGKPFELTLRALDKVSTAQRNERDVWFIGGTWYSSGDGKTEEPPRFHTIVWFADVLVGQKEAVEAAPAGCRPHEAITAARHQARWPLPPRGCPMPSPAELHLLTPVAIPSAGYPVTCGVPMPPGALKDAQRIHLRDESGVSIPLQCRAVGFWPDGSARWVLIHGILPGGSAEASRLELHFDEDPGPPPPTPVRTGRDGDKWTIDTGAVTIRLGSNPRVLVDEVTVPGRQAAVMRDLECRMLVRRNGQAVPVVATCEGVRIEQQGPVAVRVEVGGSLDTAEEHVGRFLFRIYAYAGLATIQTHFRTINDLKPEPYQGTVADAPLDVEELALLARVPGREKCPAAIGTGGDNAIEAAGGSLSLRQETQDRFLATVGDEQHHMDGRAQGWIAVEGDGGALVAAVSYFWQQYPKSLVANADELEIGLFAPSEAVPLYRPRYGEAKRHDVWLTFSDQPTDAKARRALGLLAETPPRLFNGRWFCSTGAINVLDPAWFENHPSIKDWVAKNYGDVVAIEWNGQFGIRNFGDHPYGSGGQWFNGYWAAVQGPLNWGLAGGDLNWLRRSHVSARHIADVDCAHIAPDHPDWPRWHGCTIAMGYDHSVLGGNARWPAFQIGESLILDHWMTGDPDSREAGLANADYLIRNPEGAGSTSARCQARPMLTLLRAYQATSDPKYLEAARTYLALDYQLRHVIRWRRGAYIQPTYQNWRVITAGLSSMYAANVYEYYRLTGDLDAAQLVVAIADAVYAEAMLPQEDALGSFIFYVRYSRSAWYYVQMATLFHMAYDLTYDLRFLRAARAAFERYLLGEQYQTPNNFGWLDPEYGGWYEEYKHVATEPFHITRETPDPDPANFVPKNGE